MKVVIIEGACNKSEWLFWKFLSEQVFVNIQGRVYGAGGTQHFANIATEWLTEPQSKRLDSFTLRTTP